MLRRHRRPVAGAALAGELGVSLRTLYRDIAPLQALGADIAGEAGVGYVLRPGFLLPPLMFSTDETEALALGLRWIARETDASLAAAAEQALAKIGSILPPGLRERLEDEALLIAPRDTAPQVVDLAVVRRALREERKLAITYADAVGATTTRTIWPVALGFFETRRMLAAWCELRTGFRHFRTDRLLTAEVLAERLPRPRRALLAAWRRTMLTETSGAGGYTPVTSNTGTTP